MFTTIRRRRTCGRGYFRGEVKYTRSYDVRMTATPHNEEDFQRLRNSTCVSAEHPRLKLNAFDAAYFGSGSWLKV